MPTSSEFECRSQCGACCIAPSITSAIPDMPLGKPAGVPCQHLDPDFRCRLFHSPLRPVFCSNLKPSLEMCGYCRNDALYNLDKLEVLTQP